MICLGHWNSLMGSVIFDVSGGQLGGLFNDATECNLIWIKNPKVKIYFGA